MNTIRKGEILRAETLLTEKSYSILLVEDNKGDILLVKELLKSTGIDFSLSLSASLKEALSLIPDNKFDVILLDLGLPDSIGLETLRKMQDLNINSPIVVMTGLDDEDIALKALREGAQDYLVKNRMTSDGILRGIIYSIERKKIQSLLKKNARQFSLLSSTTATINECEDISSIYRKSCRNISLLLEKTGVIGIELNNHVRIHSSGFEYIEPWFDMIKLMTEIELHEKTMSVSALKKEVMDLFKDGKLHKVSDNIQISPYQDTGDENRQGGRIPDIYIYAIGIIKNNKNYGGILIITSNAVHGDDADIIEAICDQVSLCILRKTIENELKSSESRYRKLSKELETKVSERTRDLESSNYRLNQELIERHIIEDSLKKSEASLKELNTTKDKLFNIIAHDLKNPFTCLIGTTELLNNNIDRMDSEKVKELAMILNDSAKSGFEILQNLLDWSRAQAGLIKYIPEKLNLKKIIEAIIAEYRFSSEKKSIRMVDNVKSGMCIFADKNMLSAILRNLLGNALKFTHNSGTIEVSASVRGNGVAISVKDNGIGIPEEQINALFRIDNMYTKTGTAMEHGTGLGLKICKEFIEMHGGKIRVKSTLDIGSEFIITIPVPDKTKIQWG